MPNTYTLISSNVLSSSAASVTFSAIPSTYTDLVLRWSSRSDRTTFGTSVVLKINGTSTPYSDTYVGGDGSTAFSSNNAGNAYNYVGDEVGTSQTANTFNSSEIYIPNYAGSTNKPISTFTVNENNAAATQVSIYAIANLWRSASAITSLSISPLPIASYNFVSGSSFYLYGIKNS
jgi:hypothetical protein